MSDLRAHVVRRLGEVRATLGLGPLPGEPDLRFADALDSMGLVELVAVLAEDCGVAPEAIERAAGRRFSTVAALADSLAGAGLAPAEGAIAPSPVQPISQARASGSWLLATAAVLPPTRQAAAELDALLGRSTGWLEDHAGIHGRHLWAGDDALAGAVRAAGACLEKARMPASGVGALLVTSEAPPLLLGLAAHLHHRLGLAPGATALEIGGACTGFLAALWTARHLLPTTGPTLLVAVEAPSRHLAVRPGPAGEAAALFGDGAAACLLGPAPAGDAPFSVIEVVLTADGSAGHLLQARPEPGGVALDMDGPALATRAVAALAAAVEGLAGQHGLAVDDLAAVVVHGGNGRLPPLLARRLGLPAERVWSETANVGNLGPASLPFAWCAHPAPSGPVVWAAVGAGLSCGAALLRARPAGRAEG